MQTKRALLAIIGGGNMAKAIMLGALDGKLLAPNEITVCDPDPEKRAHLAKWGVLTFAHHQDAIDCLAAADPTHGGRGTGASSGGGGWGTRGGQILLATKPQSLPEVCEQLAPIVLKRAALVGHAPVIMSILAGTPLSKIAGLLPELDVPLVRVMPNTPARLRKGMTAISAGSGVVSEDAQFAYDLFTTLGEVVKINEDLMDAFTALVGSGPAYVFYLAEAMIRAAQEVGFDRITADRLVRQTILGTGALLSESHEPPESLRAAVTSKGGTTEAAIRVLDNRDTMDAIAAAIVAGRDRGRELARG